MWRLVQLLAELGTNGRMPMEPAADTHRVKLLGEMQVYSDAGEPTAVPADRVMQRLLVALALRAGQPRRTDDLVAAIWPGQRSINRGSKSLEAPVSRLRNRLGMPIPQRRGKAYYVLELGRHEVDALDFIDAVSSDELTSPEMVRLTSMWRGDPRAIYADLADSEWFTLMRALEIFKERLEQLPPADIRQLRPTLDSFGEVLPEVTLALQTATPPFDHRKRRILIVENDHNVAQMLASILYDYHTIIATTLEEAMQTVTEQLHSLDGALVDLHLTERLDLAGLEVLSYIRDQRPELPRLLITASPPAGRQEQIRRTYGIVDTLVKGADGYSAAGVRDAVKVMFDSSEAAIRRRVTARFESHVVQVQKALMQRTIAARRGIRSGQRASYADLDRRAGELETFERDSDELRLKLSVSPDSDLDSFVSEFIARWQVVLPSAEVDR